jgi:hypothetical protein
MEYRDCFAELRGWQGQSADTTGLVFPGNDGTAFNNMRRSRDGVLKAAKITRFRAGRSCADVLAELCRLGLPLDGKGECKNARDREGYDCAVPEISERQVRMGIPRSA